MRTRLTLLAGLLAGLLWGLAGFAADDRDDLARRLEALEQKLAALTQRSFKVGTISQREALEFLDEWRDRNAELLALRRKLQDELDEMLRQIKTLRNTVSVMGPGDEKSKKQAQLVKLEREYGATRDNSQRDLQRKEALYRYEILDRVDQHAEAYAKEHGFQLVLLRQAVVFHAKDSPQIEDITQKVIEIMNDEYQAERKRNGAGTTQPDEPEDEPDKPK